MSHAVAGRPATPELDASRMISMSGWRLGVLVVCAVFTIYLSYSAHIARELQQRTAALAHQIDRTMGPAALSQPAAWVIRLNQLYPQIDRLVPPLGRELAGSLSAATVRLEHRLKQGETLAPSEQVALATHLAELASQLRLASLRAERRHAYALHASYWALIGLIFSIVALLRRRSRLTYSTVADVMQDRVFFTHLEASVYLTDCDDCILRGNTVIAGKCGYKEADLNGRNLFEDANDPSLLDDMYGQLAATGRWSGELGLRSRDGSVVYERVHRWTVADYPAEPGGIVTVSSDSVTATDEHRLMLWQAHHDNLTKLPNANLLQERLSRTLVACKQGSDPGAVISVDLDNFQQLNDSLGHAKADRVLTEAAYRIAMCARESDTVARMGSDLFVVLLDGMTETGLAERVASAIVASVARPFYVDDTELFITASAGVTVFPDDGTEEGELLQKADAARMSAKAEGGNRVCYFEAAMNAAAARRLELETHLRKAIERDELELYYQPVIDVQKDSVCGAEALLRWRNDALGMVSPGEFIPVAEDSGLIIAIGAWVIEQVQRQQRHWIDVLGLNLRVSLNVSAKQFNTPEAARGLLRHFDGAAAERLSVEVTESALMDDDPGAEVFLNGLRAAHIPVALDDFGTGYSSIGYLRDFEFDVLKVDRSFIRNLDRARDYGLVASIISMGNILGMCVTAEGVEDAEQLERLRQIGVHQVQGFFYAKPMPVAEFEAFVSAYEDRDLQPKSVDTPVAY